MELLKVKAGVLTEKQYVTEKITNCCNRLKYMTSVIYIYIADETGGGHTFHGDVAMAEQNENSHLQCSLHVIMILSPIATCKQRSPCCFKSV